MDEHVRLRMRRAHANHTHTCICGKTVRGNGGWASHRWACPDYQAELEVAIAESVERIGFVRDDLLNVRRYPKWVYLSPNPAANTRGGWVRTEDEVAPR